MKTFSLFFLSMLILQTFLPVPPCGASEKAPMAVEEAFICKDVVGLNPVGTDTQFKSSVSRLCCFTKIVGAQEPTTVTHAWYFDDIRQAWVTLEVGSATWRTYSSKAIQKHQIGLWRVEVLGPNVEVLKTIEFEITP